SAKRYVLYAKFDVRLERKTSDFNLKYESSKGVSGGKMLKNNKGIGTLLVVTVIAVVLAIVGAGIVRLSYSHYKLTKEKSVDKEKAYYFALGGIQKTVYEVQKDEIVIPSPVFVPFTIPNTSETWVDGNLSRGEAQVVAFCKKGLAVTDCDDASDLGANYQNGPYAHGVLEPGDFAIESVVNY
ncbi:MAG: hypothetical protein KAS87_00005, partial [Candidatus Omnitrophica bacterium]|nr:hypothetical protein [Candidatus Omnitrophota bacterium]